MEIKPDEITSILKNRIEGLDTDGADLGQVGAGGVESFDPVLED